jgi:hypothetical protein
MRSLDLWISHRPRVRSLPRSARRVSSSSPREHRTAYGRQVIVTAGLPVTGVASATMTAISAALTAGLSAPVGATLPD